MATVYRIISPTQIFTEPKSFAEVMRAPDTPEWKVSTDEEVQSLIDSGTFEIVNRLKGVKILKGDFILKLKRDSLN